jgi:geranylgeranyl pyrophosphate synthase
VGVGGAAASDAKVRVIDRHDGSYEVSWKGQRAGAYRLSVRVRGAHVGKSPALVRILSSKPDKRACSMHGEGLRRAVAGEPATLQVRCKDEFGNPVDSDSRTRFWLELHSNGEQGSSAVAGDALLTIAFEILAQTPASTRYGVGAYVTELAVASGSRHLIGGQVLDLEGEGSDVLLTAAQLRFLHESKTAALLTASIRLGGMTANATPVKLAALTEYGQALGLAFQVIDDLLDFTGTSDTLGKPGLQDMALGLSTAPVLYGIEEQPELKELVARKFGQPGDVHRACELVLASKGLQRTKELANFHAQAAVDACCSLPVSKQRDGLIQLCHVVLSRSS